MSDSFNAIVAEEVDGKLVDVAYSTVNYKDGLAVTGTMPICQKLPLICGIDLAGTVVESRNPEFSPGDRVLVNGYGLSERHDGGYSQKQRLKGEWLVRVPESMSLEETMAIGTAGYTSMLCVHGGPILVTGAAGGVGSVAVSLLANLGYEVHASTGRPEEAEAFLKRLGASAIVARDDLARDARPLEKETWAGVVDTVGDKTLATAIAQTCYAAGHGNAVYPAWGHPARHRLCDGLPGPPPAGLGRAGRAD
jgi:acrylyl-CoA reductase (NADPH)